MSKREATRADQITVHPSVAEWMTSEEIKAFLDVADDLESGVIPPEDLNMVTPFSLPLFSGCGTACCIAGHAGRRLGRPILFAHLLMRTGWSERLDNPVKIDPANPRFARLMSFWSLTAPWNVPAYAGIAIIWFNQPKAAAGAIRSYISTGHAQWALPEGCTSWT